MLAFGILIFAGIAVATTIITDKGITFDDGNITGLRQIDLDNGPLIITDTSNGVISALFNLPLPEIVTLAATDPMPINVSSTSFFGDVNNFDNLNGNSRFTEHNLNNGTLATASFTANNNVGNRVAFGIGSSNFERAGINLNNNAFVALNSPGNFTFFNIFPTSWKWIANSEIPPSFNFQEIMLLDNVGNLDIAGNFTGTQIYGEMWQFNLTNPNTITISVIGEFVNITGYRNGTINGFDFVNDELVAQVPGVYQVSFNVGYGDTAMTRHGFAILKKGVQMLNIGAGGVITNNNDVTTPSASGFIRLDVGDRIGLAVEDRFNPANNIEVIASNVNIVRVGD